jgi:2-oxoisovalerate dehydrogenase E1 component
LFEARGLYQSSGPVRTSLPIQPIGKAIVRRHGTAAAIVTWGTMLGAALEAADAVKNVGVIDLRWLSPLDEDALRDVAIEAGGRVVVAHEANLTGGFGAEIVARLHEMLGNRLSLKIKRVGSPDIRMPAAPALAQQLLPNAEKIAAAVRAIMI